MALSQTLHRVALSSVQVPTLASRCNTRVAAAGLSKVSLLRVKASHTDREQDPVRVEDTKPVAQDGLKLQSTAIPIAAVAAAEALRELLEPFGELVRSWNLPEWLIHWGHPGNMAVVLIAMGGYGSYLGWQIRLAGDAEAKAMARDAHPKVLAGMFFFFAVGATGGLTSLVTQGRSIFESPHAYTGMIGLALLTAQSVLSANFKGNPELRDVHAYLGTATMVLFVVHAVLGLQLGLSI